MIERVAIAGVELELSDVFATVTIRHGRGSADDPPLASTATLTLVNVDRELSSSFTVADTLEIDVTGATPRFRGRLTDASLTEDGLSVVAVSALGWVAGRNVGGLDWPAEVWSDRVERVFNDAGVLPLLELDVDPDYDPWIDARAAELTTFSQALGELARYVASAIADTPAGRILVQALTARKNAPAVSLDPLSVAYSPAWAMVDDVRNVVSVQYAGGTVTETDAGSIGDFEERAPLTISTDLQFAADATRRATLELARRSRPDWVIDAAELLELNAALAVGSPIVLDDLPAWAPSPSYLAILEGWEDHVQGEGWTMRLTLSAPRLSGYGLTWENVPDSITWANVAPAATWAEPEVMLYA